MLKFKLGCYTSTADSSSDFYLAPGLKHLLSFFYLFIQDGSLCVCHTTSYHVIILLLFMHENI